MLDYLTSGPMLLRLLYPPQYPPSLLLVMDAQLLFVHTIQRIKNPHINPVADLSCHRLLFFTLYRSEHFFQLFFTVFKTFQLPLSQIIAIRYKKY